VTNESTLMLVLVPFFVRHTQFEGASDYGRFGRAPPLLGVPSLAGQWLCAAYQQTPLRFAGGNPGHSASRLLALLYCSIHWSPASAELT
jgi:hypothetical protein